MKQYQFPDDIRFNRGLIDDPQDYIKGAGCKSWLYLVGEEFSKMKGGMSFAQVQAATPFAINIVSDPPRDLDLNLARQHVNALDILPRPTLISCRTGPRASAVAYMYSGLKAGADPDEVLAAAEMNNAPFIQTKEYKDWVRSSIDSLRKESLETNEKS